MANPATPDDAIQAAQTALHKPRTSEEIREIIREVFSKENLHLRAVITDRQLLALARAISFAEQYDSYEIREMVAIILGLTISVKARGRDDLVEGLRAALFTQNNQEERRSLSLEERLLGQ